MSTAAHPAVQLLRPHSWQLALAKINHQCSIICCFQGRGCWVGGCWHVACSGTAVEEAAVAVAVVAAACAAALLSYHASTRNRNQSLRHSVSRRCLPVCLSICLSSLLLLVQQAACWLPHLEANQGLVVQQPHPEVHVGVEDLCLEAHGRGYQRVLLGHIDRQLKGAALKGSFRRALHTKRHTQCSVG